MTTVYFPSDVVTTIGVLDVHGSPGDRILFRASEDGVVWAIDVSDSSVSYIDVKDSSAIGTGSPIDDSTGGRDSGNNTGWLFRLVAQGNAVVVGQNGRVLTAAVGATPPTDSTGLLTSEWTELGLVSGAGVDLTPLQESQDLQRWQRETPVRRPVMTRGLKVDFVLRELANAAALAFALGGGEVTFSYDESIVSPPVAGTFDERSLVVEWNDNDRHYRLWIGAGQVTEMPTMTLARTGPVDLPVEYVANEAESGGATWKIFTDDPFMQQ